MEILSVNFVSFLDLTMANICLDKNSISRGFLSPFIFHQMESLLVNGFLKMYTAHYNKVNSFICMFSITVAPSKAKHILNRTYCKSLYYTLERLYVLFYLLLKF
jgi:hypothetical protein